MSPELLVLYRVSASAPQPGQLHKYFPGAINVLGNIVSDSSEDTPARKGPGCQSAAAGRGSSGADTGRRTGVSLCSMHVTSCAIGFTPQKFGKVYVQGHFS